VREAGSYERLVEEPKVPLDKGGDIGLTDMNNTDREETDEPRDSNKKIESVV
jgi:hypothetical protein